MQRKVASEKQTLPKPRNSQKMNEQNTTLMDYELDDPLPNADPQSQRPKRLKRPKKSVNENLEPAFTVTPIVDSAQVQYPPVNEFGSTHTNT